MFPVSMGNVFCSIRQCFLGYLRCQHFLRADGTRGGTEVRFADYLQQHQTMPF
jgi:hypothetical protein